MPYRTFRERRDQYLKNLEQQIQRLQKSESDLQTQVDRLQRDLAEATSRLAAIDSKRNGFAQYPSQNTFRADRNNNWESNDFVASNDFISPQSQSQPHPHGSVSNEEVSSENGSGSAVVWVESQNDNPWQMHVQLATSAQFSSSSAKTRNHHRQPQWPLSPDSLLSENTTNSTQSPQDWHSRQIFPGKMRDAFIVFSPSAFPTEPEAASMAFAMNIYRGYLLTHTME